MRNANEQSAKFYRQILGRRFPVSHQRAMQREIHEHLLLNSSNVRSVNFDVISAADLGMLFQLTDELFFDGTIGRFVESNFNKPLTFRLSTRMTTAGGTTTMATRPGVSRRETEFEIAIATTPLFSSFKFEQHANVGGVRCDSRLEALQRIMEHEVIHLVELLGTADSNCQAKPFRALVRNYFGHKESNHQLMTPSDFARKQLGIRCGDAVTFSIRGERYRGVVNRITKRATVLVKDPRGIEYSDGHRYSKFYVPLPQLRRA
ncbi:hypothetical protein [Mariniblastus fucicola]|uniref:SprT-like family protein n=1 Tax=Mariniblastus fucicola TaxID=980251 RepID=A0A5B9PGV8_9BACT|nr:hypothetical protein [Mariniblastus fucicola]QEG23992.1 hypothetical protein MFFC18_38980 [Mariniblastus fucicola]